MSQIKSFGSNLNKYVTKFSNNLIVKTVSAGMARILPISMVGSVCTLLVSTNIGALDNFLAATGINSYLNLGVTMTNNLIALYVCVALSNEMARILKKNQVGAIMVSVMCFFIVTPMANMYAALDATKTTAVFATTYLGSRGFFVAMIVGMLATWLFAWFDDHGPKVKMPESVPTAISQSFESMFPAIFVGFIFLALTAVFKIAGNTDMHSFIYKILQAPLEGLGSSIWTMCLVALLGEFFWFFGIHGSNVTGAITTALFSTAAYENTAAVAAGLAAPHIVNNYVLNIYKGPRHFVLAAMLFWMAKSRQLKAVGQVAIVPGVFGISEPMKFGIPMVLNPIILVPMSLAPVISILIYYVCATVGFVVPPAVNLPWSMPLVISGFLAGGWQGAAVQILQCVAIFTLYLPFFKYLDKTKCAEEAGSEE